MDLFSYFMTESKDSKKTSTGKKSTGKKTSTGKGDKEKQCGG